MKRYCRLWPHTLFLSLQFIASDAKLFQTIQLVPIITSISQSSPSYHPRISLLPVALSTHLLSQILETLLCGFESRVDLYTTVEERLSIWWICERVARDLVTNLEQTARLSLEVGDSTRRRKLKDVEEVEIIAMFCQASRLVSAFAPIPSKS